MRVIPRLIPKDLRYETMAGPSSGLQNGLSQEIDIQVSSCPRISYEVKVDRILKPLS